MRSPYDALAAHYRTVAGQRAAYLSSIDELIIERAGTNVRSLLDVGAADGVRGMALADRMGAGNIVLCEPSAEMAKRCEALPANAVWRRAAQDLPADGGPFDIVLCLWNVLGHVGDGAERLKALRAIRAVMKNDGRLFLDVNNRHNIFAYGRWNVMARRLVDFCAWSEQRGDASYVWKVGGEEITGHGHLFTPEEMESLIREAGLKTVARLSVDYAYGRLNSSPFYGQLFYHLEKL